MAEYIERDQAVRKAIDACIKIVGHGISQIDAVDIADAINAIPAADVAEVRHGKWLHHSTDNNDMVIVKCSECNAKRYGMSKYCPNCGAKIDGKGEG